MDVLLNEEEEMLRRSAREVLEAESPPTLARAMETDDVGYSPELWKKLADLGWTGMALPEQYGGGALPLTHLGIVTEELGRAISPVPFTCTLVPALTIASHGTENQKRQILPRVSRGDLVLTWALTEQDPRRRPEAVKLEAVAQGDHFVLKGMKLFVENFAIAGQCLVVCRTQPGSKGADGISLLLVDTKSPGITVTPMPNIARDKLSEVKFDGVRVPRANLVGELNKGWPVAELMVDRATALLCAQISGATRKAIELAIDHAKRRVAFGRPIGGFQAIAHLCADMTIWIDGCELLTYEALWRLGEGLPASVEVSQAKAFCSEKGLAAIRGSNIIFGGIAVMSELNLTLFARRVDAWATRLGTAYEHRARVAEAVF